MLRPYIVAPMAIIAAIVAPMAIIAAIAAIVAPMAIIAAIAAIDVETRRGASLHR